MYEVGTLVIVPIDGFVDVIALNYGRLIKNIIPNSVPNV